MRPFDRQTLRKQKKLKNKQEIIFRKNNEISGTNTHLKK